MGAATYWAAVWLARGIPVDWAAVADALAVHRQCTLAYTVTAGAAMRALRVLQCHVTEHLRRVGRAYARLLRCDVDPALPPEFQTSGFVQRADRLAAFGLPEAVVV